MVYLAFFLAICLGGCATPTWLPPACPSGTCDEWGRPLTKCYEGKLYHQADKDRTIPGTVGALWWSEKATIIGHQKFEMQEVLCP